MIPMEDSFVVNYDFDQTYTNESNFGIKGVDMLLNKPNQTIITFQSNVRCLYVSRSKSRYFEYSFSNRTEPPDFENSHNTIFLFLYFTLYRSKSSLLYTRLV